MADDVLNYTFWSVVGGVLMRLAEEDTGLRTPTIEETTSEIGGDA